MRKRQVDSTCSHRSRDTTKPFLVLPRVHLINLRGHREGGKVGDEVGFGHVIVCEESRWKFRIVWIDPVADHAPNWAFHKRLRQATSNSVLTLGRTAAPGKSCDW